jgi:hypothetical protein
MTMAKGKIYVAGADNTKSYCRVRQEDPSHFTKGSFRTIDVKGRKGVKAVIGRPKGKKKTRIQSLLFSKSFFTCAPRGTHE